MSLSGKNVIVTGATSGFGVQIAKALSEAGASVFIGGRRAEQGQQVAKETGSTFHTVDVASDESNKAFFDAAKSHFSGANVDYILLNAGVEGSNEDTIITNFNIENYDYIYSVNVRGTLLGLQYGSKLLRQNGTFLVTSSVGSILPMSINPVYVSSKAALNSLVRSYAAQFAESQDERIKSLSILAVNPTVYETDMSDRFTGGSTDVANAFAKMANPSQRVGKAEEFAKIVMELVQGALPYQSGDVFVADTDTHFLIEEYMTRMGEVLAQA
jgi:NAD(P)-dependent dehydrogenase (short-subunit alcohol dehydrogenase family)